jgi:HPr kinase/phosphorylase
VGDGASETTLHATAVGLGSVCAVIRGPSGSGKSDLALRCLAVQFPDLDLGAAYLVADDRVVVSSSHGSHLTAEPPSTLAGLIEVRGLGIITIPFRAPADVALLVDLVGPQAIERLPDPWPLDTILDVSRPVLQICAFEASAPYKLLLALAHRPWESRT